MALYFIGFSGPAQDTHWKGSQKILKKIRMDAKSTGCSDEISKGKRQSMLNQRYAEYSFSTLQTFYIL